MKGTAITFLMTDNQIVNEKFLVYINDLLSTGYIADLCTQEDKDTFCNSVRGEVKQAGLIDSTDNCWDFFIDKVRLTVLFTQKLPFPYCITTIRSWLCLSLLCMSCINTCLESLSATSWYICV